MPEDLTKKRSRQRLWLASRREVFYRNKLCARCGSDRELVLHHRDPALKENHRIWSWAKERRINEIMKCDVICKSCHKDAHIPHHGTVGRYNSRKCRCAFCKAAKAANKRKYKGVNWLVGG